jgi:hypothetical protein
MRLHCATCGKAVSNELPENTVVLAWINCLECIEKLAASVKELKEGKRKKNRKRQAGGEKNGKI